VEEATEFFCAFAAGAVADASSAAAVKTAMQTTIQFFDLVVFMLFLSFVVCRVRQSQ